MTSTTPPPTETPPNAAQTPEPGGAASILAAVGRYLRLVRRYKWVVIGCTATVFAATAFYTTRQPKVYDATSTIEFDPNPVQPLGHDMSDDQTGGTWGFWMSREYYDTQIRILESQRVAEGVVRELGLHRDAAFFWVPEDERREWRHASIENAALVLRSRLRIEPIRDTRLAVIHIQDRDPRRAARLANAMADIFARQNLQQRLGSTVSALEWLTEQLDTLKTSLEQSELALHDFKRDHDILSVSLEDQRNLTANTLQQLNQQLTAISARRVEVQARVSELSKINPERPDELPARLLLENPTLSHLRQQYQDALVVRDSQVADRGPRWYTMEAAERTLRTTRTAVVREIQNVVGASRSELAEVRRAESGTRALLATTQAQALVLNRREIDYNRLNREKTNNEKLYSALLERTSETDLARMLRVNNVRLVDRALVPAGSIAPRVTLQLGIGGLIGVALGLLGALLLSLSDRTVKLQEDIEALGTVFLGLVPRISSSVAALERGQYYGKKKHKNKKGNGTPKPPEAPAHRDLVVHAHPTSAAAECVRAIRTNLLFMAADKPFHSLLVTSANPKEGKTTVAISLAIAMAQTGSRVLFVDTDMRRPRSHRAFGIANTRGLSNVLIGEMDVEDAVQHTEIERLDVLPCGPTPPNPAELLHTAKFKRLVDDLRSRYDRIVFDSPPLQAVTDAAVLSSLTDAVVLVLRAASTTREAAALTLRQLRDVRARIAGAVLNDVDLEERGGYYYRHYYYRRTGYYGDEPQESEAAPPPPS